MDWSAIQENLMPNYAQIYETLATRAARQGAIDFETLVEQLQAQGVDPDRIQQLLIDDLERDGPIFGKFLRSLIGAGESSVMAAERAGGFAATARMRAADDEALALLLERAEFGLAIDEADPDALEEIEAVAADRIVETWIATLQKTCHLCLPLHGRSMTHAEWLSLGLHPDTIHQNEGWASSCQCNLVPSDEAGSRKELLNPLVRKKIESPTGLKPSKRTARQVMQADLDRARESVAKAIETEEGRRTLRLLGKVGT